MRNYQKLRVWQSGVALVRKTYAITRTIPDKERYGLIAQMQRAAVSIPANIAEGYGRGSNREFMRFLRIARGSLFELETLAIIGSEQKYFDASTILDDLDRAYALLSRLIQKVGDE